MKHLKSLNQYLWKYRLRFFLGILFIILSNYFRILAPQLTRFVIDAVEQQLPGYTGAKQTSYDWFVYLIINYTRSLSFGQLVVFCGIVLLATAIISGFFMFLMRQTIIVMSRHIEYDQKNAIYQHYQKLDMSFYKKEPHG
jgi:ATP-binding cassette subfamily B multidrug efflux pump